MPDPQNPTPDAPLLSVESAHVRFANLTAVRDVSFTLRGGDLLGLIGPNGAGKTTLLRAITGAQPLSLGTVKVLGDEVRPGAGNVMRQIGFTPDTPWVYEELTVRQFLRFIAAGYELSASEADERIDFWLERVWLTEKAEQKIKALSRGMRQRVGIARTLMPNPALVLLDEPAAGLDPAGRVQFRQLLTALREQGKALIVSSHILSDMSEYCTHIAIMSAGAIHQIGTVAQIAGSMDGKRRRYTIELSQIPAQPPAALADFAGVSHLQIESHRLTLEYESDPASAAILLKHLVAQMDLSVSSFTAHKPGLEEAYLRTGIQQVD